jgi:hypothetical protein
MTPIRRIDLIWEGAEVSKYENIKLDAMKSGKSLPAFVKAILDKYAAQK